LHINAGHFVGVERVEPASDETAAVVAGKAADPPPRSDGSVMVEDMGSLGSVSECSSPERRSRRGFAELYAVGGVAFLMQDGSRRTR